MTHAVHALPGSPLDRVLSRLEGVRKSGRGFRACCPACGGRSAKVSIGEADNGAVLLHAFCGCSPMSLLGSVGLRLQDLYPAPLNPTTQEQRREVAVRMRESRWSAAVAALPKELAIVEIAARQVSKGTPLQEGDYKRMLVAIERILAARQVLGVRDLSLRTAP